MSRARFFLTQDLPADSPCALPLSDDDAKHLSRVLRIAPGEEIDVVSPSGDVWLVRVVQVTAHRVMGAPVERLASSARASVVLFQGVAKGEKMDTIVRQAVEIGAARVIPVLTSRSVVRLDPAKAAEKGARWRRIAESAAKQARRELVPDVCDPIGFQDALALLGDSDVVLVPWEEHDGRLLSVAAREQIQGPGARVAVVVGPEGGLSAEEIELLTSRGALLATLGPSILRTETASVVSLGIVIAAVYEAAGDVR